MVETAEKLPNISPRRPKTAKSEAQDGPKTAQDAKKPKTLEKMSFFRPRDRWRSRERPPQKTISEPKKAPGADLSDNPQCSLRGVLISFLFKQFGEGLGGGAEEGP